MRYLLLFLLSIAVMASSCRNGASGDEASNLNESAEQAITAKDYERAISLAEEALEKHQDDSDSLGMATSYYLLARASAQAGSFDKAVEYGEQGSAIARAIEELSLEFRTNNILSWAYFTLGRDFNETLAHQQRQLFLANTLNDEQSKAMVYNNYGYDATVSGAVPLSEAVEHMEFANQYYADAEGHQGRWYTLMNLTWQHRLMNDFAASERYGRLAVQQALADEDRHAIIEANTNLGETLLAQNKIAEAGPLYQQALAQSLQQEDRDKYVFDVYYSRYLWETGKKEEAIDRLTKAIAFLESSEVFYEMLGRAYLAEYYLAEGEIDKAQEQVAVFKDPRANYFSQEARVIAGGVEAQILAQEGTVKGAVELLDYLLSEVERSGAVRLENRLQALKDSISADQ